jgi:hypothetical protein
MAQSHFEKRAIGLTHNVHAFLCLLHQSIEVAEISISISDTLCIDIIGGLRKLAHIFVTEIGVCLGLSLFFNGAACARKQKPTTKVRNFAYLETLRLMWHC